MATPDQTFDSNDWAPNISTGSNLVAKFSGTYTGSQTFGPYNVQRYANLNFTLTGNALGAVWSLQFCDATGTTIYNQQIYRTNGLRNAVDNVPVFGPFLKVTYSPEAGAGFVDVTIAGGSSPGAALFSSQSIIAAAMTNTTIAAGANATVFGYYVHPGSALLSLTANIQSVGGPIALAIMSDYGTYIGRRFFAVFALAGELGGVWTVPVPNEPWSLYVYNNGTVPINVDAFVTTIV